MKKTYFVTALLVMALLITFASPSFADEKVVCPVSGKEMLKSEAKATTTYEGKTYYFCCENCQEKFLANPEKYVTQEKEHVMYTCPMHPEVKSEKPGECPKCGMKLVKMEKKKAAHTCQAMTKTEKSCCDLRGLLSHQDVEIKINETEFGATIEIRGKNSESVEQIKKEINALKNHLATSHQKKKK